MKNLKLGLVICLSMIFSMASAQTYDVTFSVDMAGYSGTFTTPTVNGSFGGWCGDCAPMTNTTGTIWEATVNIGAGVHDYKFAHDNWTGEESLFGLTGCTINTDGVSFANRQIDVQADVVLPTVCWEECVDCATANSAGCTDSAAQNYDAAATVDDGSCQYLLTLTVDMSQQTSSGPVNSVFGSFNGWTPGATVLTDNGDGTWSATLTVGTGNHEYKFHNDGVGALGEEIFAGGETCTITTGAFTNRIVNVTGDTTVGAVCWQSCDACVAGSVPGCTDASAQNFNSAATDDDGSCQYLLTVTVDMSEVTDAFTTPEINGGYNGWCGGCNPLSDNGDGTWTGTFTVPNGIVEYKFAADSWAIQEDLNGAGSCVNGIPNREVNVTGDTVVPEVCWGACLTCAELASSGCTDSAAQNYDATATTDDGSCQYLLTLTVDMSLQTSSGPVNSVFGSFNGWTPGANVLTDNGDGTWSTTLTVGAGNHEYKFHNDGVGALGEEIFAGGETCTITTGAFTNRLVTVAGDTTVDAVCWESCDACAAGTVPGCTDVDAQNYNAAATTDDGSCQYLLTVTVDMSEVTDGFTTPEINGNYNGWCGGCNPLSDNGDGTWTGTFTVQNGQIEYKFAADSWAIQEDLTGITGCVVDFGGNWNRVVQVTGDTVVGEVCWGSCDTCQAAADSGCTDANAQNYDAAATTDDGSCEYLLTVTVDMSTQGAIGPVNSVFGSFNGWTPGATVLTDNGDGTWSTTITVQNGTYEYKFHNDGVGALGEEIFAGGETCTLTTGAFTNRVVTVSGNTDVAAVCWESCDACPAGGCTDSAAQNYDASAATDNGTCAYLNTITVDMSNETVAAEGVHVAGSFQGWNPGSTPLTDNGDGTWSYDVVATAGEELVYIFINGNDWPGQEIVPMECGLDNGQGGYNRTFTTSAMDDSAATHCFSSCTACVAGQIFGCTDAGAQNYNAAATDDDGSCLYLLTVTVDMSEVTDAYTQPTVNGTFNGWCGNCNPLTDNGDGTWSTTLTVGGDIEYKFAADDWAIQEEFVGGESCTLTTGAFTNRFVSVSADTTISVVCWDSCADCATAGGLGCTDPAAQNYDAAATTDDGLCTYLLTLTVDMSEVTDAFTQPTVNGAFNGWCGNCNPLTDNGDGTWSTTITVQNGDVEYKFAADDWAIQENFVGGESCTLTTDGFTNRVVNVTGDTTVDEVCYNSCVACGVVEGCTDPDFVEFNPDATIDDGSCLTLKVFGCAYADADNYDPQANTDDGSCMFTLGSACPGDFNEDGFVTASDLTQFLAVFGQACE